MATDETLVMNTFPKPRPPAVWMMGFGAVKITDIPKVHRRASTHPTVLSSPVTGQVGLGAPPGKRDLSL